jgi:hypothetical protein
MWDLLNMKYNSGMVHDPCANYIPDRCKFLIQTLPITSDFVRNLSVLRTQVHQKNHPLSVHIMFRINARHSMMVLFLRTPMEPEHSMRPEVCILCSPHHVLERKKSTHTQKRKLSWPFFVLRWGGVAANSSTGSDASLHTVGCGADVILFGVFIKISEMTTPEIIQMTHHHFYEMFSLRDMGKVVTRNK